MIKIYQKINSSIEGDCYRAALCSLLDTSDENVANFMDYSNFQTLIHDFLLSKGCERITTLYNKKYFDKARPTYDTSFIEECNLDIKNLSLYGGINGLFLAIVFSQKYSKEGDINNFNAVIINKDYKIVNDPCELYKNKKKYPYSD